MVRAEVTFTLSTPASVGFHEPFEVDDLWFVRPTSIKGLWRWWARAIVAGLMFENGCLRYEDGGTISSIVKYVGKDLGLGLTTGDVSEASKITIKIHVIHRPRSANRNFIQNLNRVKLLTLGKPLDEANKILNSFMEGGRFRLELKPHGLKENIFNAALKVLLLALTLGGVGKASRKGLGSIDIEKAEPIDPSQYGSLKKFIDDTINSVSNVLKIARCGSAPKIPPCTPALTRLTWDIGQCSETLNIAEVAKPYAVNASKGNVTEIFEVRNVPFDRLHNFFLRGERARVVAGHFRSPDPLRGPYSPDATPRSYILGLPREQRGTGFRMSNDINRRASTIMLSFHRNYFGTNNANVGIATFIKSIDWPNALEWRGDAPPRSKRIFTSQMCEVLKAYEIARLEFEDYVSRVGGVVNRVWP